MTGRPPRIRTFTLLGGLYVSQFLGVGFFYTALAAILRERGATLGQLSAIQLLGLVWAAKVLWAPLLDRHALGRAGRGHYRSWLIVLQPAITVGLLAMIGLDPVADYTMLLVLAGLVTLLSATQDIAADAVAVRLLEPADRGIGGGIQIAGGYLGNILGGGVVLLVYDNAGWAAAMLALAAATVLPLWQIVLHTEPARPADAAARAGWAAIVSIFRAPGVARWSLIVLPPLWLGITATYALVTPMLVDAGWSLTAIGVLTTGGGGAAAITSALLAGVAVRRWGRKSTLIGFALAQLPAIAALLPLAAGGGSGWLTALAVCLLNASYAAMSTVVYTVNTDLARPATAGTDFTMLITVGFAGSLVSGAVALSVADSVGYPPVLAGGALLVIIGAVVAARLHVGAPPHDDGHDAHGPHAGSLVTDRTGAEAIAAGDVPRGSPRDMPPAVAEPTA